MASVEAHITRVTRDDGGWYQIFTDDDEIKKLKTKIEEKGVEAGALKKSGDLVLIEYTPKASGNINPHTGKPYPPDYWYERAGSIEVPAESDDGIEIVKSERGYDSPEKNWRIALQTGGKLAVATLPYMGDEPGDKSFEVQKQVALGWARFFFFTGMPTPEDLAFGYGNGAGAGDSPPPYGDDDIPF